MSSIVIDTGTDELVAEQDGGVLTLTMNRPEARNAMTGTMIEALGRELERAEVDPTVRCVVLTGAGKGFCAGGDVKSMAPEDGDAPRRDVDAAID
ncbi:MAG: enoyl-CoA hydratase/isomerase family protein, partial [Hyphomicrobium sp.]|nr:enoyl-CoA hydratase/isomerase family protein [Hyphomicrobium sp.]